VREKRERKAAKKRAAILARKETESSPNQPNGNAG
jgi:hypothetical protein